MLKKIVVVAGTRPEAIKLAPVVLELRRHEQQFTVVFCSTGQHKELFNKALVPFRLVVDREISIMEPNQALASLTSKALLGVSEMLLMESPDFVVVQGDTISAMAGAMAGAFLKIPVLHVEAGLRTHDRSSPFPEELCRQIIGRIAAFHFAPTERAKANLIREGIDAHKIDVTGNTVVDALERIEQSIFSSPQKSRELKECLSKEIHFDWEREKFVLVTMHRRENQADVIKNLCAALRHSLRENPSIRFVFPVHPNPKIRGLVHEELKHEQNVSLISPLEYPTFLLLLKSCYFVLSDSGGIQEEAPSFGKPVLVVRENTERPELLSAGGAKLVGGHPRDLTEEISGLWRDGLRHRGMSLSVNPFGDGRAAVRLVERLRNIS